MTNREGELVYLYCVTKAKPLCVDFDEFGIKIYPIYFQGTYAIVTGVSPEEFNEKSLKKNLTNMEWVERKARQHERVIEEIMEETAVLPFKFGTIFKTEENVKKLLKDRNLEFKQIIANLDGKQEWGLKIYCDRQKFCDFFKAEDERIKDIDKKITSSSKGKAYLLEKKKNELIKDIINEKISEYTQDSFERLKKVCLEAKINKILPKEVTERKEDMVLNAAFLVSKKREKEFNNVIEYLKAKYSDTGLFFDCSGPWPPYNFCLLEEKKE